MMPRYRLKILLSNIFLVSLLANVVYGQNEDSTLTAKSKNKISFKDPLDSAFDVSAFLIDNNGVFPVIIPITEPAVGYGGGAALLYFHKSKKKYDEYVSPDVSGIAGAYTENGTWLAGALHSHTFGANRAKTLTALAKANIRYKYFGNDNPILERFPVSIRLDSWVFLQDFKAKIKKSKFYAGFRYTYFDTEVSFDTIPGNDLINEIIKRLEFESRVSVLTPTLTFESRDNYFTPTRGINASLGYGYSAAWLGSDSDYGIIQTNFFGFIPFGNRLNSGWRYQGRNLVGDAPFFAFPFVNLRGIPAMRFQGDNTLVVETEWSYNVHKRWYLNAFTGAGQAFSDINNVSIDNLAFTLGTGIRYKIARLLGIQTGLDFAWGNAEDFAFYVVFGTSWNY